MSGPDLAPIELVVSEIRATTIEVRRFGGSGDELAPVAGPIMVTLAGHNVALDIDWTWRGEPPSVGTRCTLTFEANP